MFGLITLISFLAFNVYSTHGQDPTAVCIDANGIESAPPCMVDEGAGVYMIKVTLTDEIASQLQVQGVISETASAPASQGNGLATVTTDYEAVNFALSITDVASAPTDFTIPITIVDDTEVEPTEEFLITIQTSSGATCTTCSFVIQIIDNDGETLPEIILDKLTYTVCEGEQVIVGVTRSSDAGTTAINVGVSVSPITANLVDDFTFEINPTMVSVDSGATEYFTIPTIADGVDEGGAEMFEIRIDQGDTYVLGDPSTSSVLINDPENPAISSYWIEYSDYRAIEDNTPFTFNVKRSLIEAEATITFSTNDVTTSTAAGTADYEAVSGQTLTFAASSDTVEGSIVIISDANFEGEETFEISISNPSEGTLSTCKTTTAVVTLQDAFSTPTFLLGRALYSALESSAGVDIDVCREGDATQIGSIVLASSDVDALEGTDYTAVNTVVEFAANEDKKTERILITDDNLMEATKLFTVTLSEPTGGVVGVPGSASVAITDDDYCYSLTSDQFTAQEPSGSVQIGVTKTGNLELATEFSFTAGTDGTATPTEDFTADTASFTFAAGESTVTVAAFTLVQDNDYAEGQEQFTITLTATDSNRICAESTEPLVTSTATVTIEDSIPVCSPACVNGECTGANECTCTAGYTGLTCNTPVCNPVCQNSGQCTSPNICSCTTGFSGATCGIGAPVCNPTCQNGECSTSGQCVCASGFTGAACDQAVAEVVVVAAVLPITSIGGEPAVFTPELNDPESNAFKDLQIVVCAVIISAISSQSSGVSVCVVIGFTAGSIIAETEVTVQAAAETVVSTETVTMQITQKIEEDPEVLGVNVEQITSEMVEVTCPSDYCENEGTCIPKGSTAFDCLCPAGFEGNQCETISQTPPDNGPGSGSDSTAELSVVGFIGIILGGLAGTAIIGIFVFIFLRAVNRNNPHLYMPNDMEQRQRILQQGGQPAILVDDGVIRYRYYAE